MVPAIFLYRSSWLKMHMKMLKFIGDTLIRRQVRCLPLKQSPRRRRWPASTRYQSAASAPPRPSPIAALCVSVAQTPSVLTTFYMSFKTGGFCYESELADDAESTCLRHFSNERTLPGMVKFNKLNDYSGVHALSFRLKPFSPAPCRMA